MKIFYVGALNIGCITMHIKLFSNVTCTLEGSELNDYIFINKKKTLKTDMLLKICHIILSFKGQVKT